MAGCPPQKNQLRRRNEVFRLCLLWLMVSPYFCNRLMKLSVVGRYLPCLLARTVSELVARTQIWIRPRPKRQWLPILEERLD